jgi:hypothetical protein
MKRNLLKAFLFSICLFSFSNLVLATSTQSSDTVMSDGLAAGVFGIMMLISLLFSVLCYCIPILFGLVFFVIWIWMLVDLLKRDEKDFGPGDNNKIIWLLVLLLTNWIGAAVYYFMVYNKKCCK